MKFLFKILVFSFVLVGVGFFTSCEEKKTTNTQVKRSVKKPAVKKPATEKSAVENESFEDYERKKPVKEAGTDVGESRYRYFLVIGSFQGRGNAERLRLELRDKYPDAGIINTPEGLYRVYYKKFSNRKEAFRELEMARNTVEGKNAWLHIK